VTCLIDLCEVHLFSSRSSDGQPAKVAAVEPLGSEVIIDIQVNGEALEVRAPGAWPEAGCRASLRADPAALRAFDRPSGVALT